MKVWTNTQFTGHWPVGVAAVVVADTPEIAAALLNHKLKEIGLEPTAAPEQFDVLQTEYAMAVVLNDGDY